MAVGGQVWGNTTVSSVGATTAIDGALNDDVVDNASIDVELGSLSIGTEVDKELSHALERLLGPATLSVLECLSLGVTANTTSVASEGDDLSVLETVAHVVDGLLERETLAGTSDFVCSLVVGTEITNSALSRC